jgi:hypothetical protein
MEYIENDDCEIVYSIRDLAIDVIKTLVRREVSLLFVRNKRLQPFMQMLVCEMADVDFEKIEYNELTCQDLAKLQDAYSKYIKGNVFVYSSDDNEQEKICEICLQMVAKYKIGFIGVEISPNFSSTLKLGLLDRLKTKYVIF